jgi:predicted ATPase/DNA-binding NarL/FixJ family response regulator
MARPIRRAGNLPAEATSFIGRRRELAEVRTKLAEARLIGLVGPGGVGKTRLAVRAAAQLARGFPDGAWLVELAEVLDPKLVGGAVLAALGLRDQAAAEPMALILSYLGDKELLLVVDNCEHLLEEAARVVTEVLKAAPGVRVIATSREPLSAAGEHVVPVTPLELPLPNSGESLALLRRNEAVALFTERAAAASGTFELSAANRTAVARLCRRLDGLPLAIELAAVRTRVLAVEQILDRLSDRFSLLTGGGRAALPRHQTLRTTIEWSHDLLDGGERTVLRRCCAFAGRFTLEDVEAVCVPEDATPTQALDTLSSLVDKSLVMREDANGLACYRLHETMREYAVLKLREAAEEEAVGRRCAQYYRERCQSPGRQVRLHLLEWLPWADLEIDNVRAVLQRCLIQRDASLGIDISMGMSWYWITRATTEGIRWLGGFLALKGSAPELRAWAHFIRGFLAILKADPAVAGPELAAAVAAARGNGQRDLLAEALSMASVAQMVAGDRATAERLLDEARQTVAEIDYVHGSLAVLQARAVHGFFGADLKAVKTAAEEGARLAEELGDLYILEVMLMNLGSVALIEQQPDQARPLFERSLRIARQIDDRVAQSYLVAGFSCLAVLTGDARRAARLLGAAQTTRAEAGASIIAFLAQPARDAEHAARAALEAAQFEAESCVGRSLSREAAISLALGEATDVDTPEHGPDAGPETRTDTRADTTAATKTDAAADVGLLAKREAEVARLIADGQTNRQIGARLFISERTVDSHVRSILTKLGFTSRAQIAVWMTKPER